MNIYAYKQHSVGTSMIYQRGTKAVSDGPGARSLLKHLKTSGNITERTEWEGQRYVKLCRPLDFDYAKSWIQNTRYLLDCERPSMLTALALAQADRSIWLSFE